MIFIRDAITDPETGFFVLKNTSGETAPKGAAVCWASAAGTHPGADFAKPTTATLGLLIGITAEAILNGASGLVQPVGYAAEALVINSVGTPIVAGDILVPVTAQWYLARSGAGNGTSGRVHAGEAVAIAAVPAAALHKVFIGNL